jgi:hypothetical protein
MSIQLPARQSLLAVVAGLALIAGMPAAIAQTTAAKPAAKAAPKAAKKAPAKAAEPMLAAATPEQVDAAARVYYGAYQCEFKETIDISESSKYPSYVELKHGKNEYLMKPVFSSTGAVRLEDVHGETLMVQIASKSMLLNVKTAHRIVDDCVSPKQREIVEAAKMAKMQEASATATPAK